MSDRSILRLLSLLVILASGLFLVDLLTPLGVSAWFPYVGVVLLALWFPSRRQTYAATAVCTVLVFLGLFSPFKDGTLFGYAAINRLLGVGVLWMTAILGLAARRTQ